MMLLRSQQGKAVLRVSDIPGRHAPNHVALQAHDRTLTYAELELRSTKFGHGLLGLGVTAGSRVAYFGKNSARYFECLVGCAKVRAVMIPLNWRLAPTELAQILRDSAAGVIVLQAEYADAWRSIQDELPLKCVVLVQDGAMMGGEDYESWLESQSADALPDEVEESDPILQLYTSGTTGNPKGVVLSQRAILYVRALPEAVLPAWNRWTSSDVALVAMPVFHIGGTASGLHALCMGAKAVVVEQFGAESAVQLITRERITRMFMVPSAMKTIVDRPDVGSLDFSSLKIISYGASPIDADLLRAALSVFGCGFVQNYGLTETAGVVVCLDPEDHASGDPERLRSAGRPLPGVEVRVRLADGADAAPHQAGEILIRSPSNMSEYWGQPDATAQCRTEGGWLRTGDVGYMDDNGYLFVVDRLKDMIITGGENVYPAEVEKVLVGHPDVEEAAVIGLPDSRWGEAVTAIIVAKPGSAPTAQELMRFARTRLGAYKIPKQIEFATKLPKNSNGKILKKDLRELYAKRTSESILS
jgi:acyl-CoA synthetase (AMP-forming)/AMP-acid ligase II